MPSLLLQVSRHCLGATLLLTCLPCFGQATLPALEAAQLEWLAARIYANECNSKPRCLTAWNDGEEFPSLGIGHFIWYQAGQHAPFTETFPTLLAYLQLNGVRLPRWLSPSSTQPWADRASFLAALDEPQLTELRELLSNTQALQAAYIVERFRSATAEPHWLAAPAQYTKLQAVAAEQPPYGLYALIDYVHFKGEGTNPAERYQGKGWGLWQVLEAMPAESSEPLSAFVLAAKNVLSGRVVNAPSERNEQRWLAGWHNRIDTYLPPSGAAHP